MNSISELTKKLLSLDSQAEYTTDTVTFFHKVSSVVHSLALEIRRLELAGIEKKALLIELENARALHGQSTFISRLQSWPRGYQGDFETIEYLCNGTNGCRPNSLAYYLEQIALSSPIAQQHKNKVCWQAQNILRHATTNRLQGRILSIGCGGCRDLRLIQPALNLTDIELVINDIDEDAIDFSRSSLESIWRNITPIIGDSFRKSKMISEYGPFRLIVAGGLFDYLPDKYAGKLMNKLIKMLVPNGELLLTNILTDNPWRTWVDYLADWSLIERKESDIRRVLDNNGMSHIPIKAEIERSSLTGLYTITNQEFTRTHLD